MYVQAQNLRMLMVLFIMIGLITYLWYITVQEKNNKELQKHKAKKMWGL